MSVQERMRVERYIMTDKSGVTHFVYCVVFYEEIRKSFLANTQAFVGKECEQDGEAKKDCVESLNEGESKELSRSLHCPRELLKSRRLNASVNDANKEAIIRKRSNSSANMQLNKPDRKAELSSTNLPEDKSSPIENDSYYAPLAICLKTKNLTNNAYEKLLIALLKILCTESSIYSSDLQNLMYSYSEFLSHIIFLTHMVGPPPGTSYMLQLGLSEVPFTEDPLSRLPCENDSCVAQLFSILTDDHILILFRYLLLDVRVILYTKEPNSCYFIIKGLNQLMFPFSWQFSKGIAPNLSLLTQPHPYFYGLVNASVKEREAVSVRMRKEGFSFLMMDVVNSKLGMNIERMLPEFPQREELCKSVAELRLKFGVESGGAVETVTQEHVLFAKAVRAKFFQAMSLYAKDAGKVFKRMKEDDFILFSEQYIVNFAKYNDKASVEFMKELRDSQCFATLYDEISMGLQRNYARFEAITSAKGDASIEYMQVHINSSEPTTISRMAKLADTATKRDAKALGIDWIKELHKMKDSFVERCNQRKDQFSQIIGSRSLEEQKTLEITMDLYKNPFLEKRRKEPLIYGPKGLLSFCHALFSLSEGAKNTLNLFENVNSLLRRVCSRRHEISFSSRGASEYTRAKSSFELDFSLTSPSNSLARGIEVENEMQGVRVDEEMMSFSSVGCCQFFLLCAIYYCRYQPQPAQIVNATLACNP